MDADSGQKRDLTAAQRGLIVQRVLVDGRTPEEAGKPFGIDGWTVARWVTAYRRYGMAALHENGMLEGVRRRWLKGCLARIEAWLRSMAKRPAARTTDGDGNPTRRWRRY
jgi:transposase